MIKLTKENIDSAIVSKGNNIVNKLQQGYILTDETLCTFNSLMIFKELFDNKCKMLDAALENLYYIADRLIPCDGGDEPTPSDVYYNIFVSSNKSNARYYINNVERSSASYPKGTRNIQVKATCSGYYDKTFVINELLRDYNINFEFTQDDIRPQDKYSVTVDCNVSGATIEINGQVRSYAVFDAGTRVTVRAYKTGYTTFETTIQSLNNDEVIHAIIQEDTSANVTLTVNTSPSNANVVIYDKTTGLSYNTKQKTFTRGTIVKIVTTLEGYNDDVRDNIVLNSDKTINIQLVQQEEEKYTVVVNTIPNEASAVITDLDTGNVYMNSGQFTEGTRLSIVASAEGYFDKTLNYTVNSADAVNGVITKTISLESSKTLTIRIWSDSQYNNALSGATVVLEDIATHQLISPVQTSPNVFTLSNCKNNTNYQLRVTKTGYTQQNNNTITISGDTTVDIYMKANSYNLRVTAVDTDNYNTPIQNATVLINDVPVNYSNGISDAVQIQAGTEVVINVSATGYQNVQAARITMPFNDYTYQFNLSQNIAVVNVTVLDYSDNTDITQNSVIKINGNTGNNQSVSPGNISIEVTCNSGNGYLKFTGTRTVVVGQKNISISLKPYMVVIYNGYIQGSQTPVYMTFVEREQNDNIVTRLGDNSIQFKVPYGEDISGDFTVEHYVTQTIENRNITDDDNINLYFAQSDVKITFVRQTPNITIYQDGQSNIVSANYVYVRKGTSHSFTASKQNYISKTVSKVFNSDETINFKLFAPIYIHLQDSNNNPISGATINLYPYSQSQTDVYRDEGGQEVSAGTYYVEWYDDTYNISISKSSYVTLTDNFVVQGQIHKYYTLQDDNITLTVLVKNKKTSQTITGSTIYVDNVRLQNTNSVVTSKGEHTILVEKTGFGTVNTSVTLTQSETVTIELSDTLGALITGKKSDVQGDSAYQGVTVTYRIGSSSVENPVANDPNNPVDYELPYNTPIYVTASATGYQTKTVTVQYSEDAVYAQIEVIISAEYTLTINVLDADTQEPINNAVVTFNIE